MISGELCGGCSEFEILVPAGQTHVHHDKPAVKRNLFYVAHPMNIATTAIVSLNPCARIGAHKLRPDTRYAPPSIKPE